MKPKIFISRSKENSSVFIKELSSLSKSITTESLIKFSPIPFVDLPKCDWIFFYSQSGIKYFFDNIQSSNIEIGSNVKFATFGESSATLLKTYIDEVDFAGNSEAAGTAKLFQPFALGKSILFVKGKNSLDSLRPFLKNQIQYLDFVVYDNTQRSDIHLEYHDILVFTSPMNLKSYFNTYPIIDSQNIFLIGPSTASAARDIGINNYSVSEIPSLASLVDSVKDYLLRDE